MVDDEPAYDDANAMLQRPDGGSLAAVQDIAERALWNPALVSHADLQKLAAAVVSCLRGRRPPIQRARFDETDGAI